MRGRILACICLCSLFFVVGGDAQSPNIPEKPVWTLQFIKVMPDEYAATIRHLDDQWMRIREEAKHQGAVLSYQRISNAGIIYVDVTRKRPSVPEHKLTDPISIVLVTEYASFDTYLERDKLFASISEHLPNNTPPGVLKWQREDVFETDENPFLEVPAEGSRTQLKYLAKQ